MAVSSRTAWTAGILALLGVGVLVSGEDDAKGAAAALPTGGGTATVGPGSLLQTRPVPAWTSLSSEGQAAYVDIAQQQLAGPLAYSGVTANGNWNDPGTVAAVGQFLIGNRQGANAYGYTGGANEYADIVALIEAIDDIARSNTGAPRASDYVAPSSGLLGSGWLARPGAAPTSSSPVTPPLLPRK